MASQNNVLDCYNKTAAQYARNYFTELDHKHLDRLLLDAFAAENKAKGKMVDMGCGPGQTTAYLHSCGVKNLLGTDLSPAMITEAKRLNSAVTFEAADMLNLHYADNCFASGVAFYAIVHFTLEQLAQALAEVNRVLITDGEFLFSFHIGSQQVHMDTFMEQTVDIDFYFFEVETVKQLAHNAGFEVIDILQRQPYPNVEYPSQRAYFWLKKQ